MSNPNGLLGQKSCRYLNQGRTLNDLRRSEQPSLAEANTLKGFESLLQCLHT